MGSVNRNRRIQVVLRYKGIYNYILKHPHMTLKQVAEKYEVSEYVVTKAITYALTLGRTKLYKLR